ncbi:MAG: hypothetical protein AAGG48_14475 [Planctomycetota bacterium]
MTVQSCHLVRNRFRLVNREFIYYGKYRIETDDRSQSAYEVLSQATLSLPDPFPDYFATYSLYGTSDPSAFMQEADCDAQDDKTTSIWIANAVWSPIRNTEASDTHTSRSNPLSRPVIYSREWEEISVPVEKGWNNEALTGISRAADTEGPIQNAAGQEPSTPILSTKRIPVIVAKKNYATLNEIDAIESTYGDSLNTGTFGAYSAGECLFRGITASQARYEGGVQFYTGTTRIACQKGGWSYAMVNRGYKFLDSGVLTEATALDDSGNEVPVAEPINLELDGSRTPDGSIGTIINYRTKPRISFSGIGV